MKCAKLCIIGMACARRLFAPRCRTWPSLPAPTAKPPLACAFWAPTATEALPPARRLGLTRAAARGPMDGRGGGAPHTGGGYLRSDAGAAVTRRSAAANVARRMSSTKEEDHTSHSMPGKLIQLTRTSGRRKRIVGGNKMGAASRTSAPEVSVRSTMRAQRVSACCSAPATVREVTSSWGLAARMLTWVRVALDASTVLSCRTSCWTAAGPAPDCRRGDAGQAAGRAAGRLPLQRHSGGHPALFWTGAGPAPEPGWTFPDDASAPMWRRLLSSPSLPAGFWTFQVTFATRRSVDSVTIPTEGAYPGHNSR